MKKFLFHKIIFLLLFFIAAGINAQVLVSLPDTSAKSSEIVYLPLTSSGINRDIDYFEFRVNFDKDILKAIGVETANSLTGAAGWEYVLEKKKDHIKVLLSGDNSTFRPGVLLYLIFEVKDDAKDREISPLRFEYFEFSFWSILFPALNHGSLQVINTAQLNIQKTGNGSGKISVDGKDKNLPFSENLDLGSIVSISALPDEGSRFVLWDGSVTSQNKNIEVTIDGDKNLTAEFELQTFVVDCTADPSNGGNTQGCGNFKYGETANLSAVPESGWEFVNWTENGNVVSNQKNYSFVVTKNRNLTANFRLKTFSINCSSDPSTGGYTEGCGDFKFGETANLTATSNTGYDFVNWTEDGNEISKERNISFTVNGYRNLTANFQIKKFTIDCSAAPSSAGSTEGCGNFEFGETAKLNAFPAAGREFVNWTENGNEVSNQKDYSFTVTKNRNLTANFRLVTLSISCSSNPSAGGNTEGCGDFEFGQPVNLNATPNVGYNFVNWTENGNVVSAERSFSFNAIKDRNLTANFQIKSFNIDCSAVPAGAGSTQGCGKFNYGTQITISANPNSGWNFVNWMENGSVVSSERNYTFTVTGARNLTANFGKKTYTINCSANPTAGGSTSGCGIYEFNDEATLTATPSTGWSFVNWTENGNEVSTDRIYKFNVKSNQNLTANFKLKEFRITCSSNPEEGGTTEGCGWFKFGQTIKVTAAASNGYSFLNWTEDGNVVSTEKEYQFTVSKSRNLIANFTVNNYTINCSAAPSEGGTTSGCGTFKFGTDITLSASPKENYDFVNWTENGNEVSTNPNYSFTVRANRNLTANFSLQTHNISCISLPAEGGSTSGCGTFEFGKIITLKATPEGGWAFLNWTIDEEPVSTNPEYSFTVTGPMGITANFTKITFAVDCASLPISGGVTSGCGFFYFGQQANLTAIPNAGYQFDKWTENGELFSEDKNIRPEIENNRTFTAHFSREEYKISCSPEPTGSGITSGCGFFYYDQTATLTAMPNEGWTFTEWTIGDSVISSNLSFSFKVKGNEEIKANFEFVTSVKDLNFENLIPDDFYLANNYPNPFNPTTIIEFGIPFESEVVLNIYDISGQLIQEVIGGESLRAGKYSKTIHLNNYSGEIASGIYFYQMLAKSAEGKSFVSVKKMLYLK